MGDSLQAPAQQQSTQLFPSAAQPNLIRAQQKDELYLQYLVDSCHDAVRRVLGPRAALRWAAETRLLAELLYYGLTTGTGLQTLGEEYCDVLQVAGSAGLPPGTARRGLLVLLQALGPYLADRFSAPQDDDGGFAAWQAEQLRQAQRQQPSAQASSADVAAQQQQQQQAAAATLLQRLAAAARRLRQAAQYASQPVTRYMPAAVALLRAHMPTLLRIHLALFYIYGMFYQPSKRITGVRYLFLGRAFEGRPSYHVLGLLLFGQLGISGLLWLLRRYGSGGFPMLLSGGGAAAQGAGSGLQPRHAVLLSEDGKPLPDGNSAAAAAGASWQGAGAATAAGDEVPGSRKCPLCLSARAHPTATPCGHVFCWQCIAEWGNQKPECPLCRADFTPSSLVCVQHADF